MIICSMPGCSTTAGCKCGNGFPWQRPENPLPNVYVLPPEDFDKILADLESPSPPTESIKRGAELLRKMYPRS